MKGIIAEINGKYAIILTKDGLFKKIKAEPHMTVGSEIDINCLKSNGTKQKLISKVVSLAAAALLVLGTGYGVLSYSMPYSYIDFDINPSIELTVNIYDRIINAEALNSDGQVLLGCSKLKNTKLSEGVSKLISSAAEQGYFKSDASTSDEVRDAVLFTVSSSNGNKSKALKEELVNMIEEKLSKESIVSDVLVGEATLEQRDDARKVGTTPGKLALIENAIEAEPELSLEELKSAAVRDLVAKAKDNKSSQAKKASGKANVAEDKKTESNVTKPALQDDKKETKIVLEDEGYISGNKPKANDRKLEKNSSNTAGDSKQVNGNKADKDNKDKKNNKNDKNDKNSNINKNNSKNKNNKDVKNNNSKNNNENKKKSAQNEKKLERERQKLKEELLKQIYRDERQNKQDNKQRNNLGQTWQEKGSKRKR